MPEQQLPSEPNDRRSEWTVLTLLLEPDQQRPWALEELAREIGDRVEAEDAVANLKAAGLLHRTGDGFVFVTRAAARFHEIAE